MIESRSNFELTIGDMVTNSIPIHRLFPMHNITEAILHHIQLLPFRRYRTRSQIPS
jgi:hypothetical protein